MGSVKLPQAQFSQLALNKPKDQSDMILQVLSQNPLASGIDQATPQIMQALVKRQQMRKQAMQVKQLAKLTGIELPEGMDITPDMFEKISTINTNKEIKKSQAAKDRVDLELKLEGLKTGSSILDPLTGKIESKPGVTGLSIKYDANGNPFIERSPDYSPGTKMKTLPRPGGNNSDPLKELQNDLDPSNPKSGMQKLFNRRNASDYVLTLLDQSGGNPNSLQSAEAAQAVASLVSGSSNRVAQQQLEHLTPSSAKGDIMRQISYLSNEPRSMGQQEFFKSLRDTAIREKQTVDKQIHQTQISKLGRHETTRKYLPDSYNATLRNYGLDPSRVKDGMYQEPQEITGSTYSPDKEKRYQEWKKANGY